MKTAIFSPALEKELVAKTEDELKRILFLENHPEYPTHYLVDSIDPYFNYEFKDIIGEYRAVFQFKVDELRDKAEELGYDQIIYMDDPSEVIDRQEHLDDPYPFDLNIDLKPFQLQGFNYCRDIKSDIITWSTGTGKSVYAVAKAKYLIERGLVDRVVVVSKGHNKINWQRQFDKIGDLPAEVAEAPGNNAEKRRARRTEIYNSAPIFVINYEKLRYRPEKKGERGVAGDGQELEAALKGQRVYFIWDEMPTRLKNTSTVAWKGAKKILGVVEEAWQSMLTATPLENSPEDIYSCVKLLNPDVFGNVTQFRQRYAKSFNPFQKWQVELWDINKLQEMGMRLAHMTHQANKYRDPSIAAQFPTETWEDIIIDLSDEDRSLYTQVEKQLAEEFQLDPTENILPKLMILQMICNNPTLLNNSDSEIARRIVEKREVTDRNSMKLQVLQDLLDQVEGKVVLFSMYNDFGSRPLSEYVQQWGHSYVLYDGNAKQMQDAQDRFTNDPQIKVFISSDKGSDSINLEAATTVINYDLPWLYSRLLQRVNRINRITSTATNVWYFNLICAGTMEERKQEILLRKKLMQEAVDDPAAAVMDAISALTADDYRYILLGSN